MSSAATVRRGRRGWPGGEARGRTRGGGGAVPSEPDRFTGRTRRSFVGGESTWSSTRWCPTTSGACIANIVPAVLEPGPRRPPWLPLLAAQAEQLVLLVLDGLGWEQLQARQDRCPVLHGLQGGPVASVAPSTTATALTSIATGLAPGEHGVVGYRVAVDGEVLNVLRWTTPRGDARRRIDPEVFQPTPAFCGHRPPIVTKAEFSSSGFSGAHLCDVRFNGYRVPSTLVTEVAHQLGRGESVRVRLLRRHRQGRPRVRAGRVLRRRAGGRRPPGRRAARGAAARCGPGGHRRPRPGRRRRQPGRARPPGRGAGGGPDAARAGSDGSTPAPGASATCSRPPSSTTATWRGCARSTRPSRRAGGARW